MIPGKTLSASLTAQPVYIEDVFSTYLYTGNGSTQTITNNIDLSGEGGMVWIKGRSTAGQRNGFFDTLRGASNFIWSDSTAGNNVFSGYGVTNFGSSSFSLGDDSTGGYWVNGNNITYASWTFRKAEKFFDVVTYTGNGSTKTVSHNLGSAPGCIIVKDTSSTMSWVVYHRSNGNDKVMYLNGTQAVSTDANVWNSYTPTTTDFQVGGSAFSNSNGDTYVAYLFAHDAGGFGLSGTDNVVSCGSFTTDGSGNATVSLGYEPQWVLIKQTDGVDSWYLNDNMRGMTVFGNQPNLSPNSSAAESAGGYNTYPNATGFTASVGIASKNYIYIAIRRGPMKKPTVGTSVFTPLVTAPTSGIFQSNILTDTFWVNTAVSSASYRNWMYDRLRGNSAILSSCGNNILTAGNDAEGTYNASASAFQRNEDFAGDAGFTDNDYAGWAFKRAPGFFDTVCYTGTGANRTVSHNLTVVPELMLVKRRDTAANWAVYSSTIPNTKYLILNDTTSGPTNAAVWNSTTPTASVFSVGTANLVNASAGTYVALLFATLDGVSKVGSYTGNGTSQTINCGFTTGARFILIKATSGSGAWYVYDSARGIVSGNDPQIKLNVQDAQGTFDAVDPDNSGFIVNNNATNFPINVNGTTYLFFAIA